MKLLAVYSVICLFGLIYTSSVNTETGKDETTIQALKPSNDEVEGVNYEGDKENTVDLNDDEANDDDDEDDEDDESGDLENDDDDEDDEDDGDAINDEGDLKDENDGSENASVEHKNDPRRSGRRSGRRYGRRSYRRSSYVRSRSYSRSRSHSRSRSYNRSRSYRRSRYGRTRYGVRTRYSRTRYGGRVRYYGRQRTRYNRARVYYRRRSRLVPSAYKTDVNTFVKSLISSYSSYSHAKLAAKIQSELSSRYTGHYFATNVYNPCSGYDKHTIYGTNYISIFRMKGHNVVVAWVSKSKSINKSSASSALSKVTDSGDCYAKNQAEAVWNKLGGNAVMAMVVRHGNGLRSTYNTNAAVFYNYRCKRECDFWGNNCDHKSSLVIMYGSA